MTDYDDGNELVAGVLYGPDGREAEPVMYPADVDGIRAALTALGGTSTAVAEALAVGGYAGDRDTPEGHPLARYLAAVIVGARKVEVPDDGYELVTDDEWTSGGLPEPAWEFAIKFDSGGYPNLRRRAGSAVCASCGDEADAEPGSMCGRDLSEERGLPDGSVLCCGTYRVEHG